MHRLTFIASVKQIVEALDFRFLSNKFRSQINGYGDTYHDLSDIVNQLFKIRVKYAELQVSLPLEIKENLGLEECLNDDFLAAVTKEINSSSKKSELNSQMNYTRFSQFVNNMVFLVDNATKVLSPHIADENFMDKIGKDYLYFRLSAYGDEPLSAADVSLFLFQINAVVQKIAEYKRANSVDIKIHFVDTGSWPLDFLMQIADPNVTDAFYHMAEMAFDNVVSSTGRKAYMFFCKKIGDIQQKREARKQNVLARFQDTSDEMLMICGNEVAEFISQHEISPFTKEQASDPNSEKEFNDYLRLCEKYGDINQINPRDIRLQLSEKHLDSETKPENQGE